MSCISPLEHGGTHQILDRIILSLTLFQIHLNFQLHPTEPANYTGSYTTLRKEIEDIGIATYRNAPCSSFCLNNSLDFIDSRLDSLNIKCRINSLSIYA